MAEYILTRKKKSREAAPVEDLTQDEQSGMLSNIGAGALSGLHTVGSILSWPSRLLHGGINAAYGGKEGFGENYLNPFDSRGGVEGSRHLINAGILAENDPHAWEWGDLARGVADVALDPTTYLVPFGKTAKGIAASKTAKGMTAGRVAQHAAGERALLTAHLPFMSEPIVELGVGPGGAAVAEGIGKFTGLTKARDLLQGSQTVKNLKGTWYAPTEGVTHPDAQDFAITGHHAVQKGYRDVAEDIARGASGEQSLAKQLTPAEQRMAVEQVAPSKVSQWLPHPAAQAEHMVSYASPQALHRTLQKHGVDVTTMFTPEQLDDLTPTMHAPMFSFNKSSRGGIDVGVGDVRRTADERAIKEFTQQTKEMQAHLKTLPKRETLPDGTVVPHREREWLKGMLKERRTNKEAMRAEMRDHIVADLQAEHMPDEGLLALAKALHHKEPSIGLTITKDHAKRLQRQFPKEFVPRELPGGKSLHPEVALKRQMIEENLRQQQEWGVGKGKKLDDTAGYGFRQYAITPESHAARLSRGSKVMPAQLPEDAARQRDLMGHVEGSAGINKVISDPALHGLAPAARASAEAAKQTSELLKKAVKEGASPDTLAALKASADEAKGLYKGDRSALVAKMEELHGKDMNPWYQTPKQMLAVKAAKKEHSAARLALREAESQKAMAKTLKDTISQSREVAEQKLADLTASGADTAIINAQRKEVQSLDRQWRSALNTEGNAIEAYTKAKGAREAAKARHMAALDDVVNRYEKLADRIVKHPEYAERGGIFTNDPLVDESILRRGHARKIGMAPAVYGALRKNLMGGGGDQSVTLGAFLKASKFEKKAAAEKIAGRAFEDADELKEFLKQRVDGKLVQQLNKMSEKIGIPESVKETTKPMRNWIAAWKAITLAAPSSRSRDFFGGGVQNALHGWLRYGDAKRIMEGGLIDRDLSHVPFIDQWYKKTKLPKSKENTTEAVRQFLSIYLPKEHNILADVPTGQVGAGVEQLLHNVPGRKKTNWREFAKETAKTFIGKGKGGETWFGKPKMPGESTPAMLWRRATHPVRELRGVNERPETMFAPVKAMEDVASAGDSLHRYAPFLDMTLNKGYDPEVAAKLVNQAQVDYSPHMQTELDRFLKNTLIPFWSFNKGIVPETARQLVRPISPTAQAVRVLDRMHGSDASIPDHVTAGTAIPLGESDDGTRRYITSLGLMHEPGINTLGMAAAALSGQPGAARAFGYDSLGLLNPLLSTPLQRITGQSFYMRGRNLQDLDPTTGRLLSNVGETLGLREPGGPAVNYPGARTVDMLAGLTPFWRYVGQSRVIADPRKDLTSKFFDTLTGAKIADVSPGQQITALQKKAEDLARSEGAFEQRLVGFSKDQIEALKATNPELAAKQERIQQMLTSVKRRKKLSQKAAKAEKEQSKS